MRRIVLLWTLGVLPAQAADRAPLTFEEIVARAVADPAALARRAALAGLERDLALTGPFAREGPTLEAELGPRRLDGGVVKAQAGASVEVPLLAGREQRTTADTRLREASGVLLEAEAVESRLRLRRAYLDAWLEQEHLVVSANAAEAMEQISRAVRERVEAGADAPYEVALVEGDLLRSRTESDEARAVRGEAWADLAALANLPPEPLPLAPPGPPDLHAVAISEERFAQGVLLRAARQRGALETAFVDLEQAQRRSRWSLAGSLGKEGEESFATVGAGYRFPRRGEKEVLDRERGMAVTALARQSEAEIARLRTRFETARSRIERFGPLASADSFDEALRAVSLRMELGKERPSQVLQVRRQILEARAAALRRIRDAHVLIAEIVALTAQETP